jgi:cytochrome b
MAIHERQDVTIWDFPTRAFHWSLVGLVGSNLFIISPRGGAHTIVHFMAGYGVAGLLLFRLAWGFFGSPRSLFADFLRPWPVVKAHIERLRRLNPPHSVGHNPLGGWMIATLLATLAAMIATGLFAAGRRAEGPFAHLLSPSFAHVAGNLHVLISDLLIGFIAVHVAGVAVDWFLTGENLVKSMVTGRKQLPRDTAASERPLAPLWRATLIGLLALGFAAGLALATNFPPA